MDRPRPDLRLIVITDRRLAAPRDTLAVVEAALAAGAPAIQLRDKEATPRELYDQAVALVPLVHKHHALLFVNDRLDVALAAGADGAHLGPDDVPLDRARMAVPEAFLLGWSTDDPAAAVRAREAGADYIGCGAVFGTTSKAGLEGERIGTNRLRQVVDAVDIPVVGIGGVTTDNVSGIADAGAAGAAVIGAVMAASDTARAVRRLLEPFHRTGAGESTP